MLTKNLSVKKGGGTCLTISANNVTIDLGGGQLSILGPRSPRP
jgi:hypothetical protein